MVLALRWLVFLLPSILLLVQVLLAPVDGQLWLLIGFGASAGCGLLALSIFRELPSIRFSALFLSIIALPWLFIYSEPSSYFSQTLSQVILLFFALCGLCAFWLDRSGSWVYRRARLLSETIARKTDWPKETASLQRRSRGTRISRCHSIRRRPCLEFTRTHPSGRSHHRSGGVGIPQSLDDRPNQ